MAYSAVGTPDYIAPEILTGQGYSFDCDWVGFPSSFTQMKPLWLGADSASDSGPWAQSCLNAW